ncbi:hypothetical protein [Stenotrophomonas rhizophila]|uniref:hypothetical protein n=1 Tax=Stenotrophomonas rhizophila TaxID=216778 RepID=UPI000F4D06CC|nr:hypothetical protein [Stenotrophomonas rhizophila]
MKLQELRKAVDKCWEATTRYVSGAPWVMALAEVGFSLLVSNCALLFAVFVYMVHSKGEELSFELALRIILSSINKYEIVVYILAILAPAMWIMINNWKARKYNLLFWVLFFAQFSIIVCCFYIYGAGKSGETINEAFVEVVAKISIVAAVCIWYITVWFQRSFFDDIGQRVSAAKPSDGAGDILGGLKVGEG